MKDTRQNLYGKLGGKLLVAVAGLGMFSCSNDAATVETVSTKAVDSRTELLTYATPSTTSFAKAELNNEPSPIKVNIPAANDQLLIKVMKEFNSNLGFEENAGHYSMNTEQGTFKCYSDHVHMNMWKRDESLVKAQEAAANGNMASLLEMDKLGLVMNMRWINPTGGIQKADKKLGIAKTYQVVSKGGDSKTANHYKELNYNKLYNNIDVRYTRMENGALAYDLITNGAANVDAARFTLDGADQVSVAADGSLLISTEIGEMRQTAPLAYQKINGQKVDVSVEFVVQNDNTIGFKLGEYQTAKPLVIGTMVFDWSGVAGGDKAYGLGLSPHPQGGKMLMGSQFLPKVPEKVGTYKAAADAGYTNFLVQLNKSGDMKNITYFATR